MGFFDFMNKILSQNILKEKENTLLEGKGDLDIIVNMAKIKQKIMSIKIYYPEKAEEIEKDINNLESYIESCGEIDIEAQNNINSTYQNIKENFQAFQRVSEERFLFSEVKKVHRQLDKMFFGEEDEEHTITDEKIEQLEQNLQVLDGNKTKFTGIRQQQYIKEIIDTRYRLKCCKMANQNNEMNIFESTPEVEKIFNANLFIQDIENMYREIERIKFLYQMEGLEISLEEQEKALDLLIPPMSDAYTKNENRVMTPLFKDFATMESYIKIAGDLRDKVTHIYRDIQKEKRREQDDKQKKEYYKNIQEHDLAKKIREIESDSLTTTDAYKAILEYEKKVAQAKGLLNDESAMCSENIDVFRMESKDISECWLQAKESGIKISIFPNVDNRGKRYIGNHDEWSEI